MFWSDGNAGDLLMVTAWQRKIAIVLALALLPLALAQQVSKGGDLEVLRLWAGAAPGAAGDKEADRPSLTVYRPEASNGTAVVVCPGGGYGALAIDHEGKQVAKWLNSLGVTAFVLKYRLGPRYHHPTPLLDAQRAVRTVRAKADEWKINAGRIGLWGFSAGGHLASTAGTHFDAGIGNAPDPIDRVSSRPDFLILSYPVVAMKPPYTHAGSRNNLLGKTPDPQLVDSLCNETQVTSRTPPTFLMHTNADTAVPPENSVLFYLALRKAGVPAELHIYQQGRHGVGLAARDPALSAWPNALAAWLKVNGWLPDHGR
jgi:acetyl esterase/lipase